MIYAIDIDGTICDSGDRYWEFDKAKPIQDAIDKVNALFGQNHKIILYTARFVEDRKLTEEWLDKHHVRYHQLVMEKLRADIYIDNDSKRMDEV